MLWGEPAQPSHAGSGHPCADIVEPHPGPCAAGPTLRGPGCPASPHQRAGPSAPDEQHLGLGWQQTDLVGSQHFLWDIMGTFLTSLSQFPLKKNGDGNQPSLRKSGTGNRST